MTDEELSEEDRLLAEKLYAAYESGYDDPRPMHYREISQKWDTDSLGVTDAVADAFDYGCDHAESDHEKWELDELLEALAI